MPEPGEDETVRVVALDRSFHVACYKCEVIIIQNYEFLDASNKNIHIFALGLRYAVIE